MAKRGGPSVAQCIMFPEELSSSADWTDLSRILRAMGSELRCLLGPKIHFAMGRLSVRGAAFVRADQRQIVDLLRHVMIDAHDAMPDGGAVTIRAGRLREVAECAALVIHEVPDSRTADEVLSQARMRKGRSLGLCASYDAIKRVGGHFDVSCRERETVLTICFPLAE